MKKKILLILTVVLVLTTASCNNMSKSITIDSLESVYYPARYDDISEGDKELLKKYYQTEEGRNHLKELEESFLKGKNGIQKNIDKRFCKLWIEKINKRYRGLDKNGDPIFY